MVAFFIVCKNEKKGDSREFTLQEVRKRFIMKSNMQTKKGI